MSKVSKKFSDFHFQTYTEVLPMQHLCATQSLHIRFLIEAIVLPFEFLYSNFCNACYCMLKLRVYTV